MRKIIIDKSGNNTIPDEAREILQIRR